MSNTKSDASVRDAHTEVWFVDISKCAHVVQAWQERVNALDASTQSRLVRILNDDDRKTRFSVHCALRVLIELEKGSSWRGKPLTYSDQGRPELPGLGLSFSLSHTDGAGLIALSRGARVGVDIEREDRLVKMRLERQQAIVSAANALPTIDKQEQASGLSFLSAWVRLESYGKATGRGLGPLLTDAMSPFRKDGSLSRGAELITSENGLTVFDLNISPNFVAAVAFDEAEAEPELRDFPSTTDDLEAMLGS